MSICSIGTLSISWRDKNCIRIKTKTCIKIFGSSNFGGEL